MRVDRQARGDEGIFRRRTVRLIAKLLFQPCNRKIQMRPNLARSSQLVQNPQSLLHFPKG